MSSAIMRFPNDCLAAFTCSFGAADRSTFEVIGTKGVLKMDHRVRNGIIRALIGSQNLRSRVKVVSIDVGKRPDADQEIHKPPLGKPELVKAAAPSK